MITIPSDLSPKQQLIFFSGYLQALQDGGNESASRIFKILEHIDNLNTAISAEEMAKTSL